jgi:myo-inositol-1(or 4)-monophosphatase
MDPSLEFAVELSRRTGSLLLKYFNPNGLTATLKPDKTVVTEADLAADQLIKEAILQQYPMEVILSEELQPVLSNNSSAVWVIDPLDGTTNFSLGLSIWGISIARVVNGTPIIAVVNFPAIGELYTAEVGKGAWLNENPIRVKPPIPGQPTAFFACCTRTFRRYEVKLRYKCRVLGSAAYSWCAVARGMAVIAFEATPKIWDLAGGWLIVQEAGGAVAAYDEAQVFPLISDWDYRQSNFPTLMAASPELLEGARQQIIPKRSTRPGSATG